MDDFTTGFIAGQSDGNNNGCNGNNSGWGGGFGEWIFGLIVLAMFWGGNGFGNNRGNNGNDGGVASVLPYVVASNQGSLTRGDLCSEFAFNDLQNATRGISQGICDSTFALNNTIVNGFNGVSSAICNLGYENATLTNGINNNIMQNRFAAQQCCCNLENAITQNRFDNQVAINGLSTQLAQCCCENRYERAKDTCAIQQSIASSTRDIVDSQNAGTRAILDYLCNEKISDLQNENQALRLAASQSNQNNALMAAMSANTAEIIRRTGNECPIPAYVVPNPNCCYGNPVGVSYGNNGNSGCCNNCGGCC